MHAEPLPYCFLFHFISEMDSEIVQQQQQKKPANKLEGKRFIKRFQVLVDTTQHVE